MDIKEDLGYFSEPVVPSSPVYAYINRQLKRLGQPYPKLLGGDNAIKGDTGDFYSGESLAPVDQRLQDFLDSYFSDCPGDPLVLPRNTLILDRYGMARALSLPYSADAYDGPGLKSYRLEQGVLHNPTNDRRTTQGVFHVAEGGLPIAEDKLAVPRAVFKKMLAAAFVPPEKFLYLPYTAAEKEKAKALISLLLRPVVVPEVPGYIKQKYLEIRFFAPGCLAANLDFVESIFGNAGNPHDLLADSAIDPEAWTSHTGMVVLAPHLTGLSKKELGLPHFDQATERQKRDGMCWKKEEELYNNGSAFKITARTEAGVIVTVIADNYFGYCKKEVKTQISFSSNLYGLAEEEHAGGAVAYATYDLGEEFKLDHSFTVDDPTLKHVRELCKERIQFFEEGYAQDLVHPDIFYVPQDAHFDLNTQRVTWELNGKQHYLKLLAAAVYILPSGYKVRIKKQTGSNSWHLVGTVAEGVFCHKPSTVSGGGKSEISKSIVDSMIQGSIFVSDIIEDFNSVDSILRRSLGDQFKEPRDPVRDARPILSPTRSLGSVIKLFTPSDEYTDEFNQWISSIPPRIRELVFVVKRFYRPEWGDHWRQYFSVDRINGSPGHELKFNNRRLVANYLRVGVETDGSWRVFRLRQDFSAAEKLLMEDDITASVIVPRKFLPNVNPVVNNPSLKITHNVEYRLFQRPDDAVYPGRDSKAERDLSSDGSFLSNFEPLKREDAQEIQEDSIGFDQYTPAVKNLITRFLSTPKSTYFCCPSRPRLVDGKPTKNPRYLENRSDILNPRQRYIAEIGARLVRQTPSESSIYFPVHAVLPGRRNNPPDKKLNLPPLAVHNPIHYQELPELFMDFISSLTGKSPSTTGFGSEGALTKGPFNALLPIFDLNAALLSFILSDYSAYTTSAGYIGPTLKVDHDISLLVPEIWCRMFAHERESVYLIEKGYLEKCEDYIFKRQKVPASRLGYRITEKFVSAFLGRIFNTPTLVFSTEMLRPELQNPELYAQGIIEIAKSQKRAAENYFKDGSIDYAIPPLRALLHIMVEGHYQGKSEQDSEVRNLFLRENVLESSWYHERLAAYQTSEISRTERAIGALKLALSKKSGNSAGLLNHRMTWAQDYLTQLQTGAWDPKLIGTIGLTPGIRSNPDVFPPLSKKNK